MKLVYIAGPFSAPTAWAIEQNVRRAEEVGLRVAGYGAMPVIPHANTRYFHDQFTPEFWYEGTLELLRRCDGIVLFGDWASSKGAAAEREEARVLGLAAFVFEGGKILRLSAANPYLFHEWCKLPRVSQTGDRTAAEGTAVRPAVGEPNVGPAGAAVKEDKWNRTY